MKRKSRILKRFAFGLLACAALVIIWYAQSRVLAASRCLRVLEVDNAPPAPRESDYLRVAAYNIAHGRGGVYPASNWTGATKEELLAHLEKIAEQVKKADVDILVLNEADFQSTWSRSVDQALVIARLAGFRYCAEERNIDASLPFLKFRFGNAILSKYPVRDARVLRYPAKSKTERFFAGHKKGLVLTAETPIGDVRVLAVHLEHRSEEVRVEGARLIKEVASEEGPPLISLGDYNSAPTGAAGHYKTAANENAVDVLLDSGVLVRNEDEIDPAQYITFPSAEPKVAIDWILTTPELEQDNLAIVDSDLSDHLMITARIRIKD